MARSLTTISSSDARPSDSGPSSEAARAAAADPAKIRSLGARLAPWLFGVAVVAVVVVVATHWGEERALLELLRRISPAWLFVATLLQAGTYLADASTLRGSLAAAGWARPLRTLVGLSLGKLFTDQAVPSGGISGTLVSGSRRLHFRDSQIKLASFRGRASEAARSTAVPASAAARRHHHVEYPRLGQGRLLQVQLLQMGDARAGGVDTEPASDGSPS